MTGESQASFSLSVRTKIRETYQYRCAICLTWIDTTQCAHLLDADTQGELQLREAVRLGVLHEEFKRDAEMNGLVQCPNCHALFTKNRVVLSLPVPVLKYLEKYVRTTRNGALKPLHEVFDLLVDASVDGTSVGLPDPIAIIPYIGLFTLVNLDPTTAARYTMTTPHLPGLSIIHNNKFEEVPANTSATAKNVARIFDSLDIEEDTPFNLGMVPLVPGVSAFEEKRYWRIPVFAGAIFAALMGRLINDSSECEEIVLARRIVAHLTLKTSDGSGPSSGPSGGRDGGGGGSGRGGGSGSRQFKRKNASGPSAEKGKIKARRVVGRDGAWDSTSPLASPHSPRPFPLPLGQSDRLETASITCIPNDETTAMEDNSDSETGRSISAMNPPDEDNPDEWRFGPLYSTNKIIFTARAPCLNWVNTQADTFLTVFRIFGYFYDLICLSTALDHPQPAEDHVVPLNLNRQKGREPTGGHEANIPTSSVDQIPNFPTYLSNLDTIDPPLHRRRHKKGTEEVTETFKPRIFNIGVRGYDIASVI